MFSIFVLVWIGSGSVNTAHCGTVNGWFETKSSRFLVVTTAPWAPPGSPLYSFKQLLWQKPGSLCAEVFRFLVLVRVEHLSITPFVLFLCVGFPKLEGEFRNVCNCVYNLCRKTTQDCWAASGLWWLVLALVIKNYCRCIWAKWTFLTLLAFARCSWLYFYAWSCV